MARRNTIRRERIIVFMLSGLLLVLVVVFGGLITRTYNQYRIFKDREARFEVELAQVRSAYAERVEYLRLLNEDDDFLEREARNRLNYAREGELVFRFDDE